MKLSQVILGVTLVLSGVSLGDEVLDVQAFLPLFEKNSLGRKVLDIRYSAITQIDGKKTPAKTDVHLVFDAETGKYREELRYYGHPQNDVDVYSLDVTMWNGKELVEWKREVSKNDQGFRILSPGVYEHPGEAVISNRPRTPLFVRFCYDTFYADMYLYLFAKTVPEQQPKLQTLVGDMIVIEATIEKALHKFEFSKKTGALKRFDYYYPDKENRLALRRTREFLEHIACSGFWIPLRTRETSWCLDGSASVIVEMSVDPKTLRLLDAIEDSSIFQAVMPAGVMVEDQIRKTNYFVTTADALPNDVEALKEALEKMLEQAQEQAEEAGRKKKE